MLRIFRGSSSSVEHTVSLIFMRRAKWASFKAEFDWIRVGGVFHNLEASLLCGLSKVRQKEC